jgi:hypothetical protein
VPHGEFITPTDDEVLDAIGVLPETSANDEDVRVVYFDLPNGHDRIRFSYHLVAASIDFHWSHDSEEVVRITRECATIISISSGEGAASINTRFDSGSNRGELAIRIYPTVWIKDTLLQY